MTPSARFADAGRRGPAASARLWVPVAVAAATPRPAPAARPRRVAAALEGLVCDGVRLHDPAVAHAARRAFGAGDGFLPGQIIDRSI